MSIDVSQIVPWLIALPVLIVTLILIDFWCRKTDTDPWPVHEPREDDQ